MRAGDLDQRIVIQAKTVTYNSYNEPVETWANSSTEWAEIITTGGTEFYAAQKINASTTAVFRIRYKSGITVLNRIRFGVRIFEILLVNKINGLRKELLLNAKEVT